MLDMTITAALYDLASNGLRLIATFTLAFARIVADITTDSRYSEKIEEEVSVTQGNRAQPAARSMTALKRTMSTYANE